MSDENGAEKPEGPEEEAREDSPNQLPATVPDSNLSIRESRLAGSANCLNCGTDLQGPFCHYCGQPDKNLVRFFPALIRELLEDFMDFDSRFVRTIKPLLFKPGKLTRDYLDGRRFRYVPPLRLYIFSSIAFFFLAAMESVNPVQVNSGDETGIGIQISEEDREDFNEAMAELEKVQPGIAAEVESRIDGAEPAPGEEDVEVDDEISLNFNGEDWDRETNPLIVPFLPDRMNDWINDEIEESPKKGREIADNPDLIKDKFFEMIPAAMFVLLPIVALLFKFWYLFAKKYYVEHLIFALHNHSFVFVIALIALVATSVAAWQDPSREGPISIASQVLTAVVWIWIPVYLLISLKRVYQQGWGMTLLKYSAIGISYLFMLTLVTAVVALLSFVLL